MQKSVCSPFRREFPTLTPYGFRGLSRSLCTRIIFALLTCVTFGTTVSHAADFNTLKGKEVYVLFPPGLEQAAEETAQMVPGIKKDLQGIFNWRFNFDPTVILMNDTAHFHRLTHNPLVVGFAVPEKDLVVMDYAGIRNLRDYHHILKHELCHLLLHKHITHVERWFDEGIAQWSSDRVMDILHDRKNLLLPKAAFSDRVIPLGALNKQFPQDATGLRLAYEESMSFIDFIIANYGKSALLEILQMMKNGTSLRKACLSVLGLPLYQVEENWRLSLKENVVWFAHLSYYVYDFLFALGGLMLVYGFIIIWRKKRAYSEEE